MKEYKKFNMNILRLFIILMLFIPLLNYYIDPLDVFHTHNFFNKVKAKVLKNERFSKIPALKTNNDNIDIIWIGSSKTGWGQTKKYDESITNKTVLNLALNSASLYDSINMAKNAVLIHPEIKEIYFGVDFFEMKKYPLHKDNLLPLLEEKEGRNYKKLDKSEYIPLLYSLNVTKYSIDTLVWNVKENIRVMRIKKAGQKAQNISQNSDVQTIQVSPKEETLDIEAVDSKILHKFQLYTRDFYLKYYSDYILDDEKFTLLSNFVKEMNAKGVKVIIFATSMHVSEHILIYVSGNENNFTEFKRKLANITPYYDFAVTDKYTTEPISSNMVYFRDIAHCIEFLRNKISKQLFFSDEDFGVYVDKSNIEEHIEKDEKKFKDYLSKNPKLAEKVKEWCK